MANINGTVAQSKLDHILAGSTDQNWPRPKPQRAAPKQKPYTECQSRIRTADAQALQRIRHRLGVAVGQLAITTILTMTQLARRQRARGMSAGRQSWVHTAVAYRKGTLTNRAQIHQTILRHCRLARIRAAQWCHRKRTALHPIYTRNLPSHRRRCNQSGNAADAKFLRLVNTPQDEMGTYYARIWTIMRKSNVK